MADDNATDEAVAVKKALVDRGIKLWKPPYYGVAGCDDALEDLATSMSSSIGLEQKEHTAKKNAADTAVVLQHLRSFRNKAIEKLKSKRGKIIEEMTVQVLGSRSQLSLEESSDGDDAPHKNWAESVRLKGPKTIQMDRVNPDLTLCDLSKDIASVVGAEEVRLVHKGKTLNTNTATATNSNDTSHAHNNNSITMSELAGLGGGSSNKAHILCLVVQKTTTTAPEALRQPLDHHHQQQQQSDQDLIDSVRLAAGKLDGDMDVTNSSGNLVSMSRTERVAFYTALGLHALGKQRMNMTTQQQQPQPQKDEENSAAAAAAADTDTNNNNNNNSDNNLESAIVFLLEADQQWNVLDKTWQDRVDNFSLLQLDICWIYLQFESIDKLPDVIQRLDTAESVLRKQVHSNFLTLALVQAEMGNPVPAVAAIFVRLFLLQGVAQHYQRNFSESKKKLDWAWALAKSLRAVSTPDAVARLEQALGVTSFQAISALRRSNGNADQAAGLIQTDKMEEKKAFKDRYKQRKYGLCANGTDYVNLNTLDELREVLGLPPGDDERIASGLLRLGNNSFDRALEIFQECLRDEGAVLERVTDLDRSQGLTVPRKRSRSDDEDEAGATTAVDEMALASLLSMGVDDAKARSALENNSNNVDLALLSLTSQDNNSASANLEEDAAAVGGRESDSSDTESEDEVATTPAAAPDSAVDVEREAVDLLQRVLGEVLDEQHESGEGYLGLTLDEEWKYIEQYREG